VNLAGFLVCEDRVLDGPASGGKGSKGRNQMVQGILEIKERLLVGF